MQYIQMCLLVRCTKQKKEIHEIFFRSAVVGKKPKKKVEKNPAFEIHTPKKKSKIIINN